MKHARRRVESEESFGLRDTLIWCGIPIVIVLLVRMFLFGFYEPDFSRSCWQKRATRSSAST